MTDIATETAIIIRASPTKIRDATILERPGEIGCGCPWLPGAAKSAGSGCEPIAERASIGIRLRLRGRLFRLK
jgi:hypothetical protein